MRNKGFTLIELIGTIVILSLLLIIIIPAVGNKLKKGTEDAEEQTKKSIILAAKNYESDHPEANCVDLFTLQEQGYIDYKIKSPKDETKELTDIKIIINKTPKSSGKVKKKFIYDEGSC